MGNQPDYTGDVLETIGRIEQFKTSIDPHDVATSSAISLKRLADAAEHQAVSLGRIADMLEFDPNGVLSNIIHAGVLGALRDRDIGGR